ncbi:response regulator [Acidocella sp. MX-AZ03]|uniref:response regulator n=1 Tax=Acidocella sp. MX-AZ03 TaxID=2697363 RepID=UPI002FD7B0EC
MSARRDLVLVVDDTPETLGLLTEALETAGLTALVATSGEAALETLLHVTPDLILLDAMMPGLDGFETCKALKALPALSPIPVIFMTGLSDTAHVVRGLEAAGWIMSPSRLSSMRCWRGSGCIWAMPGRPCGPGRLWMRRAGFCWRRMRRGRCSGARRRPSSVWLTRCRISPPPAFVCRPGWRCRRARARCILPWWGAPVRRSCSIA